MASDFTAKQTGRHDHQKGQVVKRQIKVIHDVRQNPKNVWRKFESILTAFPRKILYRKDEFQRNIVFTAELSLKNSN